MGGAFKSDRGLYVGPKTIFPSFSETVVALLGTVVAHLGTVVAHLGTVVAHGNSGGSLVVTPDCKPAVPGSNPAISPAYSGLSILGWAAIWDGTSL